MVRKNDPEIIQLSWMAINEDAIAIDKDENKIRNSKAMDRMRQIKGSEFRPIDLR